MTLRANVKVRSKARYLYFLVGLLFLLQLVAPHKSWIVLLVGLGGTWLIGSRWARSFANSLELNRERRY